MAKTSIKARQAPPHFPFDVMAWMTDDKVRAMSLAGQGAHIALMCHAWYANPPCCIPDDDDRCARIVGISPIEWAAIRDSVFAAWPKHRKIWRRQKRLYKTLREVEERLRHDSETGRRAAKARWRKSPSENGLSQSTDDASALHAQCGRNAKSCATMPTETETETETRIRVSKSSINTSRGNERAKNGSDSGFEKKNIDSDSGFGVRDVDLALVEIRRLLGIQVSATIMATVQDPTIRKQRLADWTDWQQNLEPAIRSGLQSGHLLDWFNVQARQCSSLRRPPAVFRKRLTDAGIEVGSAKALAEARIA